MDPAHVNLIGAVREAAAVDPGRVCLRTFEQEGSEPCTYARLLAEVERMSDTLERLGVRTGDRVALVSENSEEAVAAYLAILAVSAVAVPMDPGLPGPDLNRLLHFAAPTIVLVSPVCLADHPNDVFEHLPVRRLGRGFPAYAEDGPRPRASANTSEMEGVATIIFTSGTNGDYKGVMLSHESILYGIAQSREAMQVTRADVHLCLLPMHHVYGLTQVILLGLMAGVPNTFVNTRDPATIMRALGQVKPTLLCIVPAFLLAMAARVRSEWPKIPGIQRWSASAVMGVVRRLRMPGSSCLARRMYRRLHHTFGGRLSTFVTGGATLDPQVRKFLENLGFRVLVGYGLTEASGAVTCDRPESPPPVGSSVGRPYPGLRVRIDQPNERGEGEVCIQGPTVMRGYFRDPDASHAALVENWLHTGDLGLLDDEGFLQLRGRVDDAINTASGEKVMPLQIETLYGDLPGLHRIAVFGMANGEGKADEIHAAVEVRSAAASDFPEQVRSDLENALFERAGQLASCHRIQHVHICDELPMTNTGKIRRRVLRERYSPQADSKRPASRVPDECSLDQSELQQWLVSEVARVAGLSRERIDPRRPFFDYGLDSLQATALSGELGKRLNAEIAPTMLWQYPTIDRLAAHLAGGRKAEEPVSEQTSPSMDRVAIVGMACRLPGAVDSPARFWELLQEGRDPVTTFPADRGVLELGDESASTYGAFLDDIDLFDADFFGISAREAEMLDPQQRLLLEVTWEALADAGVAPASLGGTSTGVFVGASNSDYAQVIRRAAEVSGEVAPWAATGNALSALSGRLAYNLDLSGPCETIDTACSSSLVAMHRACRAIQSGESEKVIVGGVNVIIDPAKTACFARGGFMAADGRCKSFDAAADGYVRGEGCIVLVLKRLTAAQRDRDRILGVVCSSTVNHDGASNGLTAPNGHAQSALLKRALAEARLQSKDVDVIEAHGTGTALGDPIEFDAIRRTYDQRNGSGPLRIGSVKSNIGHLEPAAGLAGVLKILLALQHEELPANLHFHQPNPLLDLTSIPARILSASEPWRRGRRIRRAGVSAFGFTGTNGHLILEEAPSSNLVGAVEQSSPVFNRKRYWGGPPALTEPMRPPVQPGPMLAAVTDLIERGLELEPGRLEPDANLIDLGVDSIAVMDVVGAFRKQFGVALPIQKLYEGVNTPQAITEYIGSQSNDEIKLPPPTVPVVRPMNGPARAESELTGPQQLFLKSFAESYVDRTRRSREAAAGARPRLADPRAVAGFAAYKKELVYPIHAASAEGAYVEDIDGNRYVDTALEFGANLFGHNPEFLRRAVLDYLEKPLPLALANQLAGDTAERLCRLTGAERVCFLTTGSEAVMSALRVARAATGRTKIALFRLSYHGNHDQVLADPTSPASARPVVAGVNQGHLDDIVLLDYGDPKAFEQLNACRDELAGVLVEPVQSRRPDLQPVGFLRELRAFTEEHGIVLIFDEMITGFRCHPAGAQGLFGISADLTLYGKSISAGAPLAVLAGRARYMDWIDGGDWSYGDTSRPRSDQTFVGGTFNGHPQSLVAARAVLVELENAGPILQEKLSETTRQMATRLNAFFEAEKLPFHLDQFSSLFRVVARGCDADLFYAGLRHHGVYANEVRNCFLSTAHGPEEVAAIEGAVRDTAKMLRKAGFLTAFTPDRPLVSPSTKWLVSLGHKGRVRKRLFCFPYAGGGSSVYRSWSRSLPDDVETVFVQFPGREGHANVSPMNDFESLMTTLVEAMKNRLDLPYAFYGHSMGAIIAFELARRIQAAPWRHPEALIVGAETAPPLAYGEVDGRVQELTDSELLDRVSVFGGFPGGDPMNGNEEQMAWATDYWLPMLRADLSLCESYTFRAGEPLCCPVTAFAGLQDSTVAIPDIEAWADMSTGRFTLHTFPGGHFFIDTARASVQWRMRNVVESIAL